MTIEHESIGGFMSSVAARSPTPGGGAVAGVVGALAAALGQMVLAYSIGKKSLAPHDEELKAADTALERARAVVLELAAEDEAAYEALNSLFKLPENDPRREEIAHAAATAAMVPLSLMAAGCDVLRLLERLTTITNRQLRSDLAIAAILAEATVRASSRNVGINLELLEKHGGGGDIKAQSDELLDIAVELCARIEAAC